MKALRHKTGFLKCINCVFYLVNAKIRKQVFLQCCVTFK